jgi:hypothetical protein
MIEARANIGALGGAACVICIGIGGAEGVVGRMSFIDLQHLFQMQVLLRKITSTAKIIAASEVNVQCGSWRPVFHGEWWHQTPCFF